MTFPHRDSLINIVGPENFSDAPEDLLTYSQDATSTPYLPHAVVVPTTVAQISQVMAFANPHKVPVIPRGAGTGYTGGALASSGGIILLMDRFTKILEIDTKNMYAIVEPGVITAQLHRAVEEKQLFYPPDPASMNVSTIGGNIAENAGGMRAVKYGVTRDYVMGLEVVLPSGQVVTTGSKCIKDVVGYDLTTLFVGSEGTLGIITRAILKLIPLPEARQTMTAAFPSLNQAAETVVDIIGSRVVPSALEFMDKHCIRAVDKFLKVGLPQDAQGFLLIETDGFASELPHAMGKISAICKRNGAMDIRIAADENQRQRLWKIRRSISAATSCFPIRGDGEDLVVPRTRIPDIIGKMDGICEKYGLFAINFGHAGDGNIHVSLVEKNGAVDMDKVNAASAEILKEAVKMEGRIAAEHGIGIVKRDKIGFNIDPATMDLMRSMKQTMDPNNILNPGKIFSFSQASKL
ncbi:MAG: FAD-linked oxidase C-terminal domain-containing protein [Desulfobacterium sp.]